MKRIIIIVLFAISLMLGVAVQHNSLQDNFVAVWSLGDYIDPNVLDTFSQQTGIQVRYLRLDRLASKLPLSQCDLLLTELPCLSQLSQQGQLIPLNTDQRHIGTRFAPLYQQAMEQRTNSCAVPALWSTMGLLSNPKASEARVLGWADLMDPSYPGKIASIGNSYKTLTGVLLANGADPLHCTPQQYFRAQMEMEQDPAIAGGYHYPEELNSAFHTDGITLAPCYAGQAISLMARMPDLTFLLPVEGSWQSLLGYAIPRQSKHQDAAFALLEYLTQPYHLAKNAAYSGWSTPSLQAYRLLSPTWQNNPLAYPGSGLAVMKPVPIFDPVNFTSLYYPKRPTVMR